MTVVLTELYIALREAGASEETAKKAAAIFANMDTEKRKPAQREIGFAIGGMTTGAALFAAGIAFTKVFLP